MVSVMVHAVQLLGFLCLFVGVFKSGADFFAQKIAVPGFLAWLLLFVPHNFTLRLR